MRDLCGTERVGANRKRSYLEGRLGDQERTTLSGCFPAVVRKNVVRRVVAPPSWLRARTLSPILLTVNALELDSDRAALAPTLGPPYPCACTAKQHLPAPTSCLIFDPKTSRNLGEIGLNLAKISDSQTAQTQHWRGFAARSVVGLLIRRSLVRAQVEEPTSTGVCW